MKKLVLLSAVIIVALSIASCEKGQLRDLENPKFEKIENGTKAEGEPTPEKTEPTRGGILTSEIRIPSHG